MYLFKVLNFGFHVNISSIMLLLTDKSHFCGYVCSILATLCSEFYPCVLHGNFLIIFTSVTHIAHIIALIECHYEFLHIRHHISNSHELDSTILTYELINGKIGITTSFISRKVVGVCFCSKFSKFGHIFFLPLGCPPPTIECLLPMWINSTYRKKLHIFCTYYLYDLCHHSSKRSFELSRLDCFKVSIILSLQSVMLISLYLFVGPVFSRLSIF